MTAQPLYGLLLPKINYTKQLQFSTQAPVCIALVLKFLKRPVWLHVVHCKQLINSTHFRIFQIRFLSYNSGKISKYHLAHTTTSPVDPMQHRLVALGTYWVPQHSLLDSRSYAAPRTSSPQQTCAEATTLPPQHFLGGMGSYSAPQTHTLLPPLL